MGLFPPPREEWLRICPKWAQELEALSIPLTPGLPVYCVLYAGYYGYDYGICTHVTDDGLHVGISNYDRKNPLRCRGHGGGLMGYYVPDITTPEGAEHFARWQRGIDVRQVGRIACPLCDSY